MQTDLITREYDIFARSRGAFNFDIKVTARSVAIEFPKPQVVSSILTRGTIRKSFVREASRNGSLFCV
jgi:hypothetical protein